MVPLVKRAVFVVLALAVASLAAGCSSAEMTYVAEGGTYTAVSVEELASSVEEPSFADERVEDIAGLRGEQLTALRAQEGSASALANILTSNFPTDTASVPYYAEEAVVEAAGISNILTKAIGTNNPQNVTKAAFDALQRMQKREEVAVRRGKSPDEI